MQRKKIKAGSFQDRAEAKAKLSGKRINLKDYWAKDEEELNPDKVEQIQNN